MLMSCTSNDQHTRNDHPSPDSITHLKTLENEYLRVKIYSNSKMEIEELKNGKKWETWPVALQEKGVVEEGAVWINTDRSISQQYPGRFSGVLEGNRIRFALYGRQNRFVGTFLCDISLEESWLIFQIGEIDESIPSLVYPPPIKSDAIVLPKGIGEIIREKEGGKIFARYVYPFYTRLNMRFIGGTKDNGAWIGIFDEGFEDTFGFVANRTATPMMTRSLGQWRHGFTYRMKFMQGDYVELAKEYRKWVIEKGQFVSLREKMNANPNLSSFLGGRAFWIMMAYPSLNIQTKEDLFIETHHSSEISKSVDLRFSYEELREVIEQYKALGMKKGFVKIAGWINGGYDYSHPDIWPPEPSLGSIEKLQSLLTQEESILVGLHDNNQDMYAHTSSFPRGVNRNADGTLLTGGIWRGGQAYILNSNYSLHYAKRNWEQIKTLKPKALFVDIITAMQLYQSFDEQDPLTKKEDLEAKIALMKFYKDQGILLGSEESADFGIPYIDWFENRHKRFVGKSIPLWPLVFHDAAFCTRYGGVKRTSNGYPGWLEDMLWGYLPHFFVHPDNLQDSLFQSLDHVDKWHEQIGLAEMTDHRFLSPDYKVEMTTFSTGDTIICNFGFTNFHYKSKLVKPKSFLIISENEHKK